MIGMEVPKFVKCPECDGKYNDEKKRRIIDSCGHPRCFSCLVLDNQCTVCKTILSRRSSWKSSRDSLLSTDDSQDESKSTQGSTPELFSKEQYLRRLYSYDPESSEQVIRRGSFDLHTRRLQDRRTKLGQHSSSALVLPNEIQNSSPTLRRIGSPRRNSLQEFLFPRKISAEDMQIFSSLPNANVASSNQGNIEGENQPTQSGDDNSTTSQVISPRSSGYWSEMEYYSDQEGNVSQSRNTDLDDNNKNNNNDNDNDNDNNNSNGNNNDNNNNDDDDNDNDNNNSNGNNNDNDNNNNNNDDDNDNNNSNGNNNDNDNNNNNNDDDDDENNKINNKSNGNDNLLHEDMELESKTKRNRVSETTKRSHFHGEINEDVDERTKTDLVLSGRSCAWQNTKALFPAESSRWVAQGEIRRNSEPDWRKYFDSHSNIRHSSLKVTNL